LSRQPRSDAETGELDLSGRAVHQDIGRLDVLVDEAAPVDLCEDRSDRNGDRSGEPAVAPFLPHICHCERKNVSSQRRRCLAGKFPLPKYAQFGTRLLDTHIGIVMHWFPLLWLDGIAVTRVSAGAERRDYLKREGNPESLGKLLHQRQLFSPHAI